MNKNLEMRLEKIERAILKSVEINPELKEKSFGKLPDTVSDKFIEKLFEPNINLISLGGKRWRPLLMVLTSEMVYQFLSEKNNSENFFSQELVYEFTPLVEFVHTASLIHDDIEDGADLRRGKSAAHITFGVDTAINSASFFYFDSPICIDKSDLPSEIKIKFYEIWMTELRRLHLGQAMDIFWHRNPEILPTLDEYKFMVRCKTGTLASMAAKIGAMCGGANFEDAEKLGEIAAEIGIGFQIIDDVINLKTGNVGKKRGDDIVEGKKSLPVLIHTQKNPSDKEKISSLMEKAKSEGINSCAVEECIKLLESSNSIDIALEEGKKLVYTNCQKFSKFYSDENPEKESPADLIINLFSGMIPN